MVLPFAFLPTSETQNMEKHLTRLPISSGQKRQASLKDKELSKYSSARNEECTVKPLTSALTNVLSRQNKSHKDTTHSIAREKSFNPKATGDNAASRFPKGTREQSGTSDEAFRLPEK
jgi:hypothetical protein